MRLTAPLQRHDGDVHPNGVPTSHLKDTIMTQSNLLRDLGKVSAETKGFGAPPPESASLPSEP